MLPGLVETPFASTIPQEVIQMLLKRVPRGQRAGNTWLSINDQRPVV